MEDKKYNTTRKDKDTKKIIETGQPRCKNCTARMTIVEMNGTQRLWCFNCESPFLGGIK